MKYPHQPSGIQRGLPFLIPDDLRERIWQHYARPLQELYQQHAGRNRPTVSR